MARQQSQERQSFSAKASQVWGAIKQELAPGEEIHVELTPAEVVLLLNGGPQLDENPKMERRRVGKTTAGKMFGIEAPTPAEPVRLCRLSEFMDPNAPGIEKLASECFIPAALLRRIVRGEAHATQPQREALSAVLDVAEDLLWPIEGDGDAEPVIDDNAKATTGTGKFVKKLAGEPRAFLAAQAEARRETEETRLRQEIYARKLTAARAELDRIKLDRGITE